MYISGAHQAIENLLSLQDKKKQDENQLTVAKVAWKSLFSKCKPSDKDISYAENKQNNFQLVQFKK